MQVIVNVLHAFRDLIAVAAAVFQLRHSLCEIRDKFGVYRVYLLWRTCKVCFSYIEVAELRQKYTRSVADRENVSSLRDFFQRDMIRSNPTMSSEKFKEALEELKQHSNKKNK